MRCLTLSRSAFAWLAVLGVALGALVACASHPATVQVACAATMDDGYVLVVEPAHQGTTVPKPPRQAKTTAAPKTTAAKPSAPAPKTSSANSAPKVPTPPKGDKAYTPPGESAYTPPKNTTQPKEDLDAAKASLKSDQKLSRSGTYTSPVTQHVYVYHDATYFGHLGWHDPYDPYDPYNITNPYSPFNGYHFAWVDRC